MYRRAHVGVRVVRVRGAEARCLAAMAQNAVIYVEKPGTGVPFARPD
jgi:hypothetical protein